MTPVCAVTVAGEPDGVDGDSREELGGIGKDEIGAARIHWDDQRRPVVHHPPRPDFVSHWECPVRQCDDVCR